MFSEFSASFAIYIFVLVIVKNDHFQQEQFYQLSVRNRKPKINLNAKRLWLFSFEIIERPKKSSLKWVALEPLEDTLGIKSVPSVHRSSELLQ